MYIDRTKEIVELQEDIGVMARTNSDLHLKLIRRERELYHYQTRIAHIRAENRKLKEELETMGQQRIPPQTRTYKPGQRFRFSDGRIYTLYDVGSRKVAKVALIPSDGSVSWSGVKKVKNMNAINMYEVIHPTYVNSFTPID